MLSCFDFARELDIPGVAARLTLAVLCGGFIGLEREYKRRSAGFRTHILICLGAAMTALTSEYLSILMGYTADAARMSAQVIAGIGFIGAGAIIVTRRQRVRGLTTAAGLWTSAIIGIACGAGYVEGAALATALVLAVEVLLTKMEHRFTRKVSDVNLFIEYGSQKALESVIRVIRENGLELSELEQTHFSGGGGERGAHYCAVLTLSLNKRQLDDILIKSISEIDDIISVEEL